MYLQKHNIPEEKVIEKNQDSVLLEFSVPENCDFFEGHFDEIHLLPAVAQIDIMMYFARKYFNVGRNVLATKRTKFGAPIFPGYTVRMNIKYSPEKNSIVYKLNSENGEKTYSTGTFSFGE